MRKFFFVFFLILFTASAGTLPAKVRAECTENCVFGILCSHRAITCRTTPVCALGFCIAETTDSCDTQYECDVLTGVAFEKPVIEKTPKGPPAPATGTTNANLPGFIQGSCGSGSIDSALGCLPTDGPTFAAAFFKWSLPLAGLIAFLLILYGSFLRIISAGNPENMQKARDIIVAALTGLLIVIFAVVLLQIITRGILGLPGFTGGSSGGGGGLVR